MLKRLMDLIISFIGLMILIIPFIFLIKKIKNELGSPVFFKQIRPGKKGIPFKMVKFRSMTDERDAEGNLLPDAKRLTSSGKWLRSTSLDELPELWNVLKGDMSLVGPRPLLMEYLPLYNAEQAKRHDVRPGITGWAQIHGRNAISWEEKFRLDVWYINNQNFLLDFKIIILTIKKVFLKDGISAVNDATMPKFTGTSTKN